MYALCLYHAVLLFSFLFHLPPQYDLYHFYYPCVMLFTLVPIFFFFSSSCPLVFQSFQPTHDITMHRQSEKYIEHILWQQFLEVGAYKGRYQRCLLPQLWDVVEQWYAYLLNLIEKYSWTMIYLSVTSCTAGLLVNRHRDNLKYATGSVVLVIWVIPLRSWQDCYLLLAIIDLSKPKDFIFGEIIVRVSFFFFLSETLA